MNDDIRPSVPMSPVPPQPAEQRQLTGQFQILREYQPGDTQDALRIAREARHLAKGAHVRLDKELGREPDPAKPDDEGEGLLGRVAIVETVVGQPSDPIKKRAASGIIAIMLALQEAVAALTTELGADRASREKAAERWRKLGWIVVPSLIIAALLALAGFAWHWGSTLHH